MIFSSRRRWTTKQLIGVVMVLVLGNLLLLREMRDHYTRPYEDQLSELKYKNGHLEHKLKMLSHIESERGGRKNNNAVTAITNDISTGRSMQLEVSSSRHGVHVKMNGAKIYEDYAEGESTRGVHVIVLNEVNGAILARRVFDMYQGGMEVEGLTNFLSIVRDGRIVIFAIKDEGTMQMKLPTKQFLIDRFASKSAKELAWRSTWALVCIKGAPTKWFAEAVHKSPSFEDWAAPSVVKVTVPMETHNKKCSWGIGTEARRRTKFCDKYEGYDKVCHCENPEPITLNGSPLPDNRAGELPIAVVAANRPVYLFRMLKRLLATPGVERSRVTVYIDGFLEEPRDVTELFGVAAVEHEPICSKNCRIAQHYLRLIRETFNRHPSAEHMIILEEDLDVAVDIMDYFSQLIPVLEKDPSVYCISAWNDQGYQHSSHDPAMLYRVETMPGLGWVLKKKMFVEELEPKWPTSKMFWDWDMWMRMDSNRKGRECIIPDISRTYHFGAKGLNMNPSFQDAYFKKHRLNEKQGITFAADKMYKDSYEKEIKRMIQGATVLDHTKNPCANKEDFIPDTEGKTYVFYIAQSRVRDWDTWNNVARCFKLWDLDVRGFHNQMWRFWIKENHIFVVGAASEYAKYKPADVHPIYMLDKLRVEREAREKAKREKKKLK